MSALDAGPRPDLRALRPADIGQDEEGEKYGWTYPEFLGVTAFIGLIVAALGTWYHIDVQRERIDRLTAQIAKLDERKSDRDHHHRIEAPAGVDLRGVRLDPLDGHRAGPPNYTPFWDGRE